MLYKIDIDFDTVWEVFFGYDILLSEIWLSEDGKENIILTGLFLKAPSYK